MPERATVLNQTLLGPEVTKGTQVTAGKRLLNTGFKLSPDIPVEGYRPMGSKSNTTAVKRKEQTNGEIEGVVSYRDQVYLLSGLLETAAISTPTGATLTRRWLFNPNNWAADDYITYTIETGQSGGFAERVTYALINSLTMRWTKDEASVSGDLFARNLVDGVTINPTPTDVGELPIDMDDTSVFVGSSLADEVTTIALGGGTGTFTITITNPITEEEFTTAPIANTDNAAAVKAAIILAPFLASDDVDVTGTWVINWGGPTGIGRYAGMNMVVTADFTGITGGTPTITETTAGGLTKLLRCLEAEWSLTGRFNNQKTLDKAKPSFSAEVERAPDHSAQIILQHDSTSVAFMTDLRAKTTKFCKIVSCGPDIETDYPFWLDCTFAFKFSSPDHDDQDDVWGATYDLIPIYNATINGFVRWTIFTDLTAL